MAGMCAIVQAAPLSGSKSKTHSRAPLLNTTLPAQFISTPDGGARVAAADDHGVAAKPTDEVFPIRWRESREIVDPDVISLIRNFRRDGLPILPLWQTEQSRVAIGVNPHGMPGIYFTQHFGG